MDMHLIQKHVMRRLSTSKELAYSELKPPRIEGNQFSYHLKTLVRRGYVKRTERGYALTTKGVHYSTQVNFEHFSMRIQPKIVTLIVCRDKEGRLLVYRRSKQPFLGKLGFPYGKIHLGESIAEAAERELREKTGVEADLTHKGIAYLLATDKNDEVITHMLFHIFKGARPRGDILKESAFGTVHWMDEHTLFSSEIMPSMRDILTIAERKGAGLAFEEYVFQEA